MLSRCPKWFLESPVSRSTYTLDQFTGIRVEWRGMLLLTFSNARPEREFYRAMLSKVVRFSNGAVRQDLRHIRKTSRPVRRRLNFTRGMSSQNLVAGGALA